MNKLRILVAEDSPTARTLLLEILRGDPRIEVVGTATNGADAVRMTVELRPDLVTMDVHMPGMDGIQATREIMIAAPTPILIVSSAAREDAALSLTATEAGALMVVPKPEGPSAADFEQQREYLLQMVHAMASVRLVRRWAPRPQRAHRLPPRPRAGPTHKPRVVTVAASTGGPAALKRVLQMLQPGFPLPILVVQHIAKGFAPGLVEWLALGSGPAVRLAQPGEPLLPGYVYIAPDERHLGLRADFTIELSGAAPIGQFRPSATYLFRSVTGAVGGAAVGVMLTGMGDDGVAGLCELRQAGAYVIAQDEPTSVVFGMAREAVRAGVVDEILPIEEIAPRLTELVQERPYG
jgi:two-component system, chemotaxis family, protein-glutamate methylesterase/glutaminase